MISITDTYLETVLKNYLQSQLYFNINNKQWHQGKLILFKQSGFFLDFLLESNKKQEHFEVPIPYNVECLDKNNIILFDYRLNTLVQNNLLLLKVIEKIKPITKNRFYNVILKINVESKNEI